MAQHRRVIRRTLLQKAQYVAERMQATGIDKRRVSRISMLARRLTERDDPLAEIPPTDLKFIEVIQSLRELYDFSFIFDVLGDGALWQRAQPVFKRCIGDPVLPQNSSDNTAGRDAQVELLALSLLQAAGLRPRLGSEVGLDVDFVANSSAHQIAVEAKRPKNMDRLEEHIRKACHQIELSGIAGRIVLDISVLSNPENQPLVTDLPTKEVDRRIKYFHDVFERDLRSLLSTIPGSERILSVELVNHQFRHSAELGWGGQYFFGHVHLRDSDEVYRQFCLDFGVAIDLLNY